MKCNHFTCHSCPPEYTFRGGYIEDFSGERWWSAELLARVENERDEARKYAQACEWALEAEQEYTARLKADLALECREVAERQRLACSDEVYSCKNAQWLAEVAKAVRATPLVTEGDK